MVDQDWGAVGDESAGDHGGADGDIVVAEDGVAEGTGEGGEEFGAAVGSVVGSDEGESTHGDEVAGDEDEVRIEGVDVVDDTLKEVRLGELVEVDVADLGDAVVAEGVGQVGDGDGAVDDVDFVAGNLSSVEGKPCCCGSGANEEFSSRDARCRWGVRPGHR